MAINRWPSVHFCDVLLPLVQYPTTWLHELGHNLYMNHAGSYQDTGGGSMQVILLHAVCVHECQHLAQGLDLASLCFQASPAMGPPLSPHWQWRCVLLCYAALCAVRELQGRQWSDGPLLLNALLQCTTLVSGADAASTTTRWMLQ